MCRKDRIDLSILMIVIITIVSLYMYGDYKEGNSEIVKKEQELMQTQAEPTIEECYYLAELSGYVVVYKSDKKTIFEYTNILVEELPDDLQIKIRKEIILKNIMEVYGFLENYSS